MSAPTLATLADRYGIEREIGHGGMATVYLADDRKHDRKVALKIMRESVASSLGAERFLREVRMAAQLSHPHIVPLIDSGESDGTLFYVTPYAPDGSLADRLARDGRLSVRDALRVAREVGQGLDYVHRSGYVHRDVKPANILFADGHALLGDFGIAYAVSDRDRGRESITGAGIVIGTPEYMSPEQASGERDLKSQSDIYSLACVVYEMLAGSPPFAGSNARVTMMRQVTETAAPIRVLRPDAPTTVERALARALAKDPAERQPTVPAFLDALETEGLEGEHYFASRSRSIAVLPFVNVSSDAENEYLSDGITDELIGALARVEGLQVASRTSVFSLKGKPQDVRAIGSLFGVSEVLEGTVRRAGDRLRIGVQLTSAQDGRLLWSQRFDRELVDVFALQDEIARTIVDTLRAGSFADLPDPKPNRYVTNAKAYGYYLKGRYAWNKRTQEGVREAIGFFERAIGEDASYALAYAGLSDSYALHVDYRNVPVQEGLERAKEYARRAIELDDGLAEAHASLAWCLFIYDWDWEASDRESRRAIELDPRYSSAHQWYTFLLISQRRIDEALASAQRAVELDPASVSGRRSIAWANYYARRFDQARSHAQRAIAMNPTAEESYRILGLALAQSGEFDEAERVMREAVELPSGSIYARGVLGYTLALSGQTSKAREVLDELGAEEKRGYVSPVVFALLHTGLGESARALDWIERAYVERRGWLAYLRTNAVFDPLRGDPRLEAIAKRMKL
ncbi:MAG TPA: protein kinase [Gemmatimonadaceae bacterium]|nr:protein kinase [Gemmatimonadaceae bacterium]